MYSFCFFYVNFFHCPICLSPCNAYSLLILALTNKQRKANKKKQSISKFVPKMASLSSNIASRLFFFCFHFLCFLHNNFANRFCSCFVDSQPVYLSLCFSLTKKEDISILLERANCRFFWARNKHLHYGTQKKTHTYTNFSVFFVLVFSLLTSNVSYFSVFAFSGSLFVSPSLSHCFSVEKYKSIQTKQIAFLFELHRPIHIHAHKHATHWHVTMIKNTL